ncbi:hypothetical protein M885DRAFT_549326, partial [Pelagophyceae sp. CCMP2097]
MQQRWCAFLAPHSGHVLSCTVDSAAGNLQSAPNEQLLGESGASRGGTPRSGGSACCAGADARIGAGAPRVPHRACVYEVPVAIEPRGGPTRLVLGFAQVLGHAACAGPHNA